MVIVVWVKAVVVVVVVVGKGSRRGVARVVVGWVVSGVGDRVGLQGVGGRDKDAGSQGLPSSALGDVSLLPAPLTRRTGLSLSTQEARRSASPPLRLSSWSAGNQMKQTSCACAGGLLHQSHLLATPRRLTGGSTMCRALQQLRGASPPHVQA